MMCPRCGKNVERMYENLCLQCYIERLPVQEVVVRRCKVCNRYFVSKKVFDDLEDAKSFYVKEFLSKKFGEIAELFPKDKMKLFEKEIVCEECKKFFSRKVEVIIQLRGKLSKEIVKKYNLSVEEVKGGFDVKFYDKRFAYELINKLKKKYNLSIKISKKLVGLKEGKRVYRDTILVRINGKKI